MHHVVSLQLRNVVLHELLGALWTLVLNFVAADVGLPQLPNPKLGDVIKLFFVDVVEFHHQRNFTLLVVVVHGLRILVAIIQNVVRHLMQRGW